jgi:DNA-binding NtrC family response regulator
MKVLVVDDLLIARNSTRILLEEAGFEVTSAYDKPAALVELSRCNFSLAVITHRVPEVLHGIQLAQIVKGLVPHMLAVLLIEEVSLPPPPHVDLVLRWPLTKRHVPKISSLVRT